jgi:cell division inhibitor SepF
MGAFKKMAEYLGLVDGELDQDELLGGEEPPQPPIGTTGDRRDRRKTPEDLVVVPSVRPGPGAGPTPLRPNVTAVPSRVPAKISTQSPRSYNDARPIGEDFREGIPVIINLTDLDDADAKRIVDFAAGLVFGLQGSIQRVTTKVFLLSPANVDVSAQAHEQVVRGDFYNQS